MEKLALQNEKELPLDVIHHQDFHSSLLHSMTVKLFNLNSVDSQLQLNLSLDFDLFKCETCATFM